METLSDVIDKLREAGVTYLEAKKQMNEAARKTQCFPPSARLTGSAADVAAPKRPDEKLGAASNAGVDRVILDMWDADIQRVEQWLRRCHPELITNDGRTCWGVLLDKLEDTQPPN